MLIFCAGRRSGFLVRSEIQVLVERPDGRRARPEMDIGWYSRRTNSLVAAWEIDGQDAGSEHFLGNSKKGQIGNTAKFRTVVAPVKVQVLYSLMNKVAPKRTSKRDSIEGWLNGAATVVTDEELMASKGIERWIALATEATGEADS